MSRAVAHPELEILPDHGGTVGPPEQGGGGDDHGGWHSNDGPRSRLKRARTILAFAVVSICTLFIALSVTYVLRRQAQIIDWKTYTYKTTWTPPIVPGLLWLNTLILLVSSATAEFARTRVFIEPAVTEEWLGMGEPVRKQLLPWLSVTLLLGLGFIGGQVVAWQQAAARGVDASVSSGGFFFYALTGAHALHVVGGLIALTVALLSVIIRRPFERQQVATDVACWYWHAMGALWMYLFALLL